MKMLNLLHCAFSRSFLTPTPIDMRRDRKTIFQGAGLTPDQEQKLRIGSNSKDMLLLKVKNVVPGIPKLCDIVEPSKIRH